MRKKAPLFLLMITILACILAFGLGLSAAGNWSASPEYRESIESLYLDTAGKMHWIRIGFWGGLAIIALIGLGGAVGGLLRVVWRRSRLVQPHSSGIFPIIENQVGKQIYYHDPNRQWAGTTVYRIAADDISTRHIVPPGQDEAQFQIATQAQATQFVAAANQGKGLTAPARRLVKETAMKTSYRPAPRLPKVVVLDEGFPEDRRLLTALRQDWVEEERR